MTKQRRPIFETAPPAQVPEILNMLAKKGDSALEESFCQQVLPAATPETPHSVFKASHAPLYDSNREPLIDRDFSSEEKLYEKELHSIFWNKAGDTNHSGTIVFVVGDRGCGKSTFISYYLRCFCPEQLTDQSDFKKKLIVSVNARGIHTESELQEKFFRYARRQLEKQLSVRGFDFSSYITKDADNRASVELMFEQLLRYKKEGFPEGVTEVSYIVVWIDNLDQTPLLVQAAAIRLISDWFGNNSFLPLWHSYIPLWPNTLDRLRRKGLITELDERECVEVPLGHIKSTEFIKARIAQLLRFINRADAGQDGNSRMAKFVDDVEEIIDERSVEFIRKLCHGDLRRILKIWNEVFRSRVLWFYERHRGLEHLGRYALRDAMLTGSFKVFNASKSEFINLYFLLSRVEVCRDILIGWHCLALLKGYYINSIKELEEALYNLGYSRTTVATAIEILRERSFFHVKNEDGEDKPIEPHRDVIDAYDLLYCEDAYIDNMAIVTPIRLEFFASQGRKERLKETVSYLTNNFANRVETTLGFLESIKLEEEQFLIDPGNTDPGTFSTSLNDVYNIPFLWKKLAVSYAARIRALRGKYVFKEVGITDSWWDKILESHIIKMAHQGEVYLSV